MAQRRFEDWIAHHGDWTVGVFENLNGTFTAWGEVGNLSLPPRIHTTMADAKADAMSIVIKTGHCCSSECKQWRRTNGL
jgi:hypothetical protein